MPVPNMFQVADASSSDTANQLFTALAGIGGMLAGLSALFAVVATIYVYRRTGSRLKIMGSADHHGRVRIHVGNLGRVPIEIKAVGFGTLHRRYRLRPWTRPQDVLCLLRPSEDELETCMWEEIDRPLTVRPGNSAYWVKPFPQAVMAQRQKFWRRKRKPHLDEISTASSKQVRAIVAVFDRIIYSKVDLESDPNVFYDLRDAHVVRPAPGAAPAGGTQQNP